MRATSSGVKDETLPIAKPNVGRLRIAARVSWLMALDIWNLMCAAGNAITGFFRKKIYILIESVFWFLLAYELITLANSLDIGATKAIAVVSGLFGLICGCIGIAHLCCVVKGETHGLLGYYVPRMQIVSRISIYQ